MKYYCTLLLLFLSFTIKAQNYSLSGNEVKITKPVLFEAGTDKLKPESDEAFEIIKKYLTDKPYISTLRIECHTDKDATAAQSLTEKRAMAVCKKLIAMGVDCKRLIAVGFGSTKQYTRRQSTEPPY
jgi:OOP family OmpA-OmpF porin